MTAAAIPDDLRPRLGRFVRLLASDQPGEVIAAADAIKRALAARGVDLNDLGDDIENLPAPVVILRDPPPPARSRRPRKAGSTTPGCIDIGAVRRREIIDGLGRASARGALSSWEGDFATSIIHTLQGSKPRLSARQYEIVERLLGKFGERRAWA